MILVYYAILHLYCLLCLQSVLNLRDYIVMEIAKHNLSLCNFAQSNTEYRSEFVILYTK